MPKKKNKLKTLAIDPGTQEMGIAILEDEDLAYYGVKTLKKKRPAKVLLKTLRKTIYKLCDDYQPDILSIEQTFNTTDRNLSLLHLAAAEVKYAAKRRGLKIVSYAPKTVRKFICGSGKATKKEVSRVIAARYPELGIYVIQDRIWKEKYWQNMFDAVAVGLTSLLMPR